MVIVNGKQAKEFGAGDFTCNCSANCIASSCSASFELETCGFNHTVSTPQTHSIPPATAMSQSDVGNVMMTDIFPSTGKHHHDPSASVPSLRHLPHSSSLVSLTRSEGDAPLSGYASAPTLVQDPSVADLPSQSDIIIAVMGPTGAGKSTFINKAAGIEETEVGHGLESCTHQIQIVRCLDTQQDRHIVFVDTPGFDDTNISDLDILQVVADWLKLTYEKNIRLSGLLFFHRISDNRMGGSPIKHLKMFQNLCGPEALKNVVLVTTMWDEVGEEEGSDRENELQVTARYWKTMIELGCHTSRFYNNTESAFNIVSQFQDARCTVLLQKELVDLHLELAETSAGRTLFSLLVEFIKKIKELLAQIEAKLKQNQHSESSNRDAVKQTAEDTAARDKTAWILRIADVQLRRYSVSSRVRVFKRLGSSRRLTGRLGPSTPPVNATTSSRQPRVSATLPPDVSSNTSSRSKITPVDTLRARASGPLTSSPVECFSPPPSPANATGQSRTHTVLQGTITALRLVQQIVGLAPVPGLQSLVGVVLNISEVVNNMYDVDDALVDLARTAGSFMVTLVEPINEQGSISTFSDSNSMNSAIEGLKKEMNRVLEVVNNISSQRPLMRFLLNDSDKAAVDACNQKMVLACGIFGIQIAFITQQAIDRIEAKLNQLALKILQESNKQTTTAQEVSSYCCHGSQSTTTSSSHRWGGPSMTSTVHRHTS